MTGGASSLGQRITNLENKILKVYYYAEITATSGQISKPTNSTILLDQWSTGEDALVCKIVGGRPDFEETPAYVSSFDANGNYILSGALPTNPAALIYVFEISRKDFDSYVNKDSVINFVELLKYETFSFALSDEATAITTGTAKITGHWPFAFKAIDCFIGVSTVSSSGSVIVDFNDKDGNTSFSTRPTILQTEFTSLTNGTQPVFSTTQFAKGDKFTVDIDSAGTGTKGLKFYINGIKS